MELKGQLESIGPEVQVSDKMKKREFVIKTGGKYPKQVCFVLINNRVDIIDPYALGEEITVSYDLSSREYQGKWYTQAVAWKVQRVDEAPQNTSGTITDPGNYTPSSNNNWEGDLPF